METSLTVRQDARRQRRRQEMLRFYAATALTLLSFKYLLRRIGPHVSTTKETVKLTSQYKHSKSIQPMFSFFFQQNHRQLYNASKNASDKSIVGPAAVGTLGITTGWMLMGLFGMCWCLDIGSLRDFREKFGVD